MEKYIFAGVDWCVKQAANWGFALPVLREFAAVAWMVAVLVSAMDLQLDEEVSWQWAAFYWLIAGFAIGVSMLRVRQFRRALRDWDKEVVRRIYRMLAEENRTDLSELLWRVFLLVMGTPSVLLGEWVSVGLFATAMVDAYLKCAMPQEPDAREPEWKLAEGRL